MLKLVFSSICPRFFPDLMGVSNSYWLESSRSRSHHIIFTTSKSWIFSTEGVRVVCCFGMVLLGKVNTFSRFCSWWSFLLVTFPLGTRADLLFTVRYSNQVHLLISSYYYQFSLKAKSYELRIYPIMPSTHLESSESWGYPVPVKRTSAHCSINASGHVGSLI